MIQVKQLIFIKKTVFDFLFFYFLLVLDITRHIPLYRAILQLLRAVSLSNQLVSLLMARQNGENRTSIAALLFNMKACVDTYASRLRYTYKLLLNFLNNFINFFLISDQKVKPKQHQNLM